VDITDSWIEEEAVKEFAGISGHDEDYTVQLAIACTAYYTAANFGCHENIYLTLDESEEYLKQYGITSECFRNDYYAE
jgi:hypothetical protein